MGMQGKRAQNGYTIIEVMLFFAVTGALMMGVLGTASLGVNSQRYNDAVNTFQASVQQEFTNATNVVNTESIADLCTSLVADNRGTSNCVIIGRLMTINNSGDIKKFNLVGTQPPTEAATNATEISVINGYQPLIDTNSIEESEMAWGTKIQRSGVPAGSNVSILILRSPRSGNVYSYVKHDTSSTIETTEQLREYITADLLTASPPKNSVAQYMCVDRSGWVITPTRVITLAGYASGPSGVGNIEDSGAQGC